MFKAIRKKVESKRESKNIYWKILVSLKDITSHIIHWPKKNIKNYTIPKILPKENHAYFGDNLVIKGKEVKIGKYCAIGDNLRIIQNSKYHNYHLPALQIQLYNNNFKEGYPDKNKSLPVVIGNDVWIGDNVILLSGVKLGDGACIGAGAVVTKEIPPYSIAVGVPARVIKYRFSKRIIKFLLNLKWWDWSEEKIKKNEAFFRTDLSKIKDIRELEKIIS